MTEHGTFDLDSTELVFRRLSDRELSNRYWLFRMMARPWIVHIGKSLISAALKIHLPVEWLITRTIFRQFCGGTNLEETSPSIQALWDLGIFSILDFAVEAADNEGARDNTADEIIRGIHFAGTIKPKVHMFAVKLTGLFDSAILEKKQSGGQMSREDTRRFELGLRRIEAIAQAAARQEISISIDAEESWIQDSIDEIALDLMRRFNRTGPIVGTTIQFYRKDSVEKLQGLIEEASSGDFILAYKAVRGAYLESERARAREMQYGDPIHSSKEETDRAFDEGVERSIGNIERIFFLVASHNQYSCEYAIDLMKKRSISPASGRIGFAQLKGMSDNISHNLAHAGYAVAKYMPYGPIRSVVPYLFRRAEENTAVSREQPARELEFIRREIMRRRISRRN